MQIAYVGNHTQTHTHTWTHAQCTEETVTRMERKEKCFIKTEKYRVREWKRVFNNKLNIWKKTWSFSASMVRREFLKYVHDLVFRIEHKRSITNCSRSNADWSKEKEKTKHRNTHSYSYALKEKRRRKWHSSSFINTKNNFNQIELLPLSVWWLMNENDKIRATRNSCTLGTQYHASE